MKKILLLFAMSALLTVTARAQRQTEDSMQMLAISGDPKVHTINEQASNDYDALVKENKSYSVWDNDWNE